MKVTLHNIMYNSGQLDHLDLMLTLIISKIMLTIVTTRVYSGVDNIFHKLVITSIGEGEGYNI